MAYINNYIKKDGINYLEIINTNTNEKYEYKIDSELVEKLSKNHCIINRENPYITPNSKLRTNYPLAKFLYYDCRRARASNTIIKSKYDNDLRKDSLYIVEKII